MQDKDGSNRYYLYAWAVAHQIAFKSAICCERRTSTATCKRSRQAPMRNWPSSNGSKNR